jgi:predicted nucleic acid-binding Zn ribbon protein
MAFKAFECLECGTAQDRRILSDGIVPTCNQEDCDGELKAVFGAPNFILKGKGWAKDGYSS